MTELNRQCEVCHIGTLRPMQATYASWWYHHLIVVPSLNAWLCDVCGEFEHEPEIIARIDMLLGSTQASPQHRHPLAPGSESISRPVPSGRPRSV